MERPNFDKYWNGHQMTFAEDKARYDKDLQKYIDYLESKLTEQREKCEEYDIDCCGEVMFRAKVQGNKITPILAMNGYGNAEDVSKIKITSLKE